MYRISGPVVLGIIYITFLVGNAYAHVGQVVDCVKGEVFEWYFPLVVLALVGIPFVLGYLGGSE